VDLAAAYFSYAMLNLMLIFTISHIIANILFLRFTYDLTLLKYERLAINEFYSESNENSRVKILPWQNFIY